MKNIHVLPTDKPSRLYKTGNFLLLDSKAMPNNTLETMNQHIYITNSEEIKEGDLGTDGVIVGYYGLDRDGAPILKESKHERVYSFTLVLNCKKIILTTDQDLIKDGVQAIDDEFLEWFVKNPSCKKVEVEEFEPIYGHQNNSSSVLYKIIIPSEEPSTKLHKGEVVDESYPEAFRKEESKQTLIDIMKSDEELGLYEQTKCYCGHTTTCDCGPEQEITLEDMFNEEKKQGVKELIDKHKQETLEEAFAKIDKEIDYQEFDYTSFRLGVKWQQERSYSEEEVIAFGEFIFKHSLLTHAKGVKNLFEQFKKN